MGSLWSVVTILGPILLIGVVIWATLRNRKKGRSFDRAEQGAKDVRRELNRDHEDQ